MLKIVYSLFLCLIGIIIANSAMADNFPVSDETTLKAAVADANSLTYPNDDIIDLQGNNIVLTSADNSYGSQAPMACFLS